MSTAAVLEAAAHNYDVEDVEYLRHGDKPLLARVYKPHGAGPFPALVECHGGAWCQSDRMTEALRHKYMASHGIVSIALDFRSGNTDPYPASVQDINYAVRWAKAHAKELKTRPDLIGLSGQSSGGHLAMLVAMRPNDPRYAAIPLPAGTPPQDASVRCVVMSWPVINPLSRYRHAKRQLAIGKDWAKPIIPRHDSYWTSEANMAGGQPDAGAGARRKGATAAGSVVPGPRRYRPRLQGRRLRASPATSRNASSPTTRRPAARSTSTTSRWNATSAIRPTCRRPATRSRKWSSSLARM